MERLEIKIDPEVFKFNDPRIGALLSARVSVEAFALATRPGDPWVLIKDTIYALTEQEYYALRAVLPANIFTEDAFRYVVDMEDLSFMSPHDKAVVMEAREKLPTCPSCKYAHYKNSILGLIKKYNIKLPEGMYAVPDIVRSDKAQYPEIKGEIHPKTHLLLDGMYKLTPQERKPCMDCVEKHIAQAWILGNESLMGYPEHLLLAIGHLGEAIDELPKDLLRFRLTLEFCLARTNYYNRPFIPINLLMAHIESVRKAEKSKVDSDNGAEETNDTLDIDLGNEVENELKELPVSERERVRMECAAIDSYAENSASPVSRIAWEGSMGALSDSLAQTAPKVANLIRNRRLLFVADPSLAGPSGYSMKDIAEVLQGI